jgi:hypothetical protein
MKLTLRRPGRRRQGALRPARARGVDLFGAGQQSLPIALLRPARARGVDQGQCNGVARVEGGTSYKTFQIPGKFPSAQRRGAGGGGSDKKRDLSALQIAELRNGVAGRISGGLTLINFLIRVRFAAQRRGGSHQRWFAAC